MASIKDRIGLKGEVNLVLRGPDGRVKLERTVKNLVVNVGLAHIASRLKDATATVMGYIAIGDTNTAPAAGNTALAGTELSRLASTTSIVTVNVPNDTIQHVTTFDPGVGTGTVEEAGIFDAATVGNMMCRTLTGTLTKNVGDSLTVTWKVTIQ